MIDLLDVVAIWLIPAAFLMGVLVGVLSEMRAHRRRFACIPWARLVRQAELECQDAIRKDARWN